MSLSFANTLAGGPMRSVIPPGPPASLAKSNGCASRNGSPATKPASTCASLLRKNPARKKVCETKKGGSRRSEKGNDNVQHGLALLASEKSESHGLSQ